MPTISAKLIRKPRKVWCCEMCGLRIIGAHIRMYGSASRGDKPYVIRVCPGCVAGMNDEKAARASMGLAALTPES